MKRVFRLPLTEATLNAAPPQRQADGLAVRRRGARSRLIDSRMGVRTDPKRDAAERPTGPIDNLQSVVSNGPRLPGDEPMGDSRPTLKQRVQVLLKWGQGTKRPTPEGTGRNSTKAQPDFRLIDAYFDRPFERSNAPADKPADRPKQAALDLHACPADMRAPELPRAILTPAEVMDVRLAPAVSSPASPASPMSDCRTTPPSRQLPVRTETAGAIAAAQARQAMLLEQATEQQNPLQPERRPCEPGAQALGYAENDEVDDDANLRVVRLLRPDRDNFSWPTFVASTMVLAAIGAGIHWRASLASLPRATSQVVSDWTATFLPSRQQDRPQLTLAKLTPLDSAPIEIVSTSPPARSLPTTYGIFASSKGQTIRLEPMNVRLPDNRIAVPGLITKPATVVVPHGRLSFVAYQRELMTSAPDNAQLRIVARVARTLSFSATGKPLVTSLDDTWAIRSVSVDLTVAPVAENREMVELQPANPDLVLSPGRYILAFKNQTYDFVVAGKPTDEAHCLEKVQTQDGDAFTECRKAP